MNTRQLGSTGPRVPRSASAAWACLICRALGPDESIATVHAALDAGITLLDTGDFYGMGHNELLLARGPPGGSRDKVQLGVKFGAMRDPATTRSASMAAPPR